MRLMRLPGLWFLAADAYSLCLVLKREQRTRAELMIGRERRGKLREGASANLMSTVAVDYTARNFQIQLADWKFRALVAI